MAELQRAHPLEAWADRLAALPEGFGVHVEPYVAMAIVRSHDPAPLGLPATPNTWVAHGDGRAIWLGPDEWLVTAPDEAPWALEARLRGRADAVTDNSAQRITLRLGGQHVRDVLAKGCAIDLHPRVFNRGSSAQTTLARAGVVLLGEGDGVTVLVRSSFAGYLADWLLDAALEHRAA